MQFLLLHVSSYYGYMSYMCLTKNYILNSFCHVITLSLVSRLQVPCLGRVELRADGAAELSFDPVSGTEVGQLKLRFHLRL